MRDCNSVFVRSCANIFPIVACSSMSPQRCLREHDVKFYFWILMLVVGLRKVLASLRATFPWPLDLERNIMFFRGLNWLLYPNGVFFILWIFSSSLWTLDNAPLKLSLRTISSCLCRFCKCWTSYSLTSYKFFNCACKMCRASLSWQSSLVLLIWSFDKRHIDWCNWATWFWR